jgi:L-aspartate oxidase
MKTNFVVIGSGIAGLNFALNVADKGKVVVVTKKKLVDSNTNFAQGGIAAVLDKTDSFDEHINDTLKTGSYHNNKKAVEFMVKKAPEAIQRLVDLGVKFSSRQGKMELTREGGHSKRRIAYVGDHTGKEIESIFVKQIKKHPNITVFEDTFALDLIVKDEVCHGVFVLHENQIKSVFANQTIVATGGMGQIYSKTANPKIATGDGVAMAIRAGCSVKDMEFIQFHPTALDKKTSPMFLLSETVRGEGAIILNTEGQRFLKDELAPRDTVSIEIYKELKKGPVYLYIGNKRRCFLKRRFPQIYEKLKKYSYDMAKDNIPVTPVAHYQCGGIKTNLHGETNLKNLFAFGEVAYTGVHGANRLASNSLLEAVVFSNQIFKKLSGDNKQSFPKIDTPPLKMLPRDSESTKKAKSYKKKIQSLMWEYVGIVRNLDLIKKHALPELKKIENDLSRINGTNPEIAEAKNMALVSIAVSNAALKRKKSLGCHFVS